MLGKIEAGKQSHDIAGGLDLMATFAAVAGIELPENDREGQPILFDSYDMSPILFDDGLSEREAWFYFTENELTPGRGTRTSPPTSSRAVASTSSAPLPRTPTGSRPGRWSAAKERRRTSPPTAIPP
jgi:hypothetical protein